MAFREVLEVQQLPPGHDQVTHAQPRGRPAGRPHGDLQQQARPAGLMRHQDVGHEGAHDGSCQLPAGVDRDNPAPRAAARGGEPLPGPGLWQGHQDPGGAAAKVVDAVVGVRREPHLRDPRPDRHGRGPDVHSPPRLQNGRGNELIARVGAQDLAFGHAPPVTDHAPILHCVASVPHWQPGAFPRRVPGCPRGCRILASCKDFIAWDTRGEWHCGIRRAARSAGRSAWPWRRPHARPAPTAQWSGQAIPCTPAGACGTRR